MKKPLGMILSLALVMSGITGCATKDSSAESASATASTTLKEITPEYDSDDAYFDWKSKSYQTIDLTGSSDVTIDQSGIYVMNGTMTDGSLIVDVDKETDKETVFLVLNGAHINSSKSAPIYVKGAKKVVILLENGTENSVTSGSDVVVNGDGEPSAAVFSKADLTITGSGTLQVTANYKDGITSKDDLKITDGTLIVNAKSDGIVGKDNVYVKAGKLTITAGKDGVRSTNDTDAGQGNVVIQKGQIQITAANDGIQAYNLLQIDDGTLDVISGGGYPGKSINGKEDFGGRPGQKAITSESAEATETTTAETNDEESKKALKAGQGILLKGGNIKVSSYEDAVHSNNDILVNGGVLNLQSGDDGLHADHNLVINNGEMTITNSYESLEGANITINSGKIKATSTDDGINVNSREGVLNIAGGEVALNANGDGTDSNGNINMTGGTVTVDGPVSNGNGSIDYENSFRISGGTLVASGSSGMAQAPSGENSQPSILMYYNAAQTAGSTITLKDKDGNTVITYTLSKQYSSVAISSPSLSVGSTYTLYSGDTQIVSFTLSDSVTYLSESGITTKPQNAGPGGGGRGPGSRPPLNEGNSDKIK